jgi:hypothetical protein
MLLFSAEYEVEVGICKMTSLGTCFKFVGLKS